MSDQNILARTLYGEAEAGDEADAIAIACVVLNRVAAKRWPNTVSGVCLQPAQFSCWNADNPRLGELRSPVMPTGKWFKRCDAIARDALAGRILDPTNGATHYYATYVAAPRWARGKKPCYSTPGGKVTHLFFNDIDTPKPRTVTAAKVGAAVTAGSGAMTAARETGLLDQVAHFAEVARPAVELLQSIGFYGVLAAGVGVGVYLAWAWWRDKHDGGGT